MALLELVLGVTITDVTARVFAERQMVRAQATVAMVRTGSVQLEIITAVVVTRGFQGVGAFEGKRLKIR